MFPAELNKKCVRTWLISLFFKVYLFILRERGSRGGAEREGERERIPSKLHIISGERERIPSKLHIISAEPLVGLKLSNHEITT